MTNRTFVHAMRPDRVVVGEVRGAEAFDPTRAVDAECNLLCTLHANGAPESLHALINAMLMAGKNVREHVVRRVLSELLDLGRAPRLRRTSRRTAAPSGPRQICRSVRAAGSRSSSMSGW
jgi:Flp pilus assembly CpaF family ATPase